MTRIKVLLRIAISASMLSAIPAAADCYYGSDCYARQEDQRWQQTEDAITAAQSAHEAESAAGDREQALEKRIHALEERLPY